jgi:hypothetical protein
MNSDKKVSRPKPGDLLDRPFAGRLALAALLAGLLLAALLTGLLLARILLLLTGFLLAALAALLTALAALLPALILIHVRHGKRLLIAGRPRKAATTLRHVGSNARAELARDLKLMVHKHQ